MKRYIRFGTVALTVVLAAVLAVTASACGGSQAGGTSSASSSEGRSEAPSFSGVTMTGESVSSEGFRGKPLVLVFWASW